MTCRHEAEGGLPGESHYINQASGTTCMLLPWWLGREGCQQPSPSAAVVVGARGVPAALSQRCRGGWGERGASSPLPAHQHHYEATTGVDSCTCDAGNGHPPLCPSSATLCVFSINMSCKMLQHAVMSHKQR
jgi:hypothetical protein